MNMKHYTALPVNLRYAILHLIDYYYYYNFDVFFCCCCCRTVSLFDKTKCENEIQFVLQSAIC